MSAHERVQRIWGSGDLDALFGDHNKVIAPWPKAPRRKHHPAFDRDVLARLEASPADLVEIDPRTLWASQPWVLRRHADYYRTGRWERTGLTSADHHLELNRFPVVVADHQDRLVIAAGHHRSTVALIEGRPLLVRRIATGTSCAVTPLLWWNPAADPIDARVAAQRIDAGERCAVATLELARTILIVLGVSADEATHRTAIVGGQAARTPPVQQHGA